MSAVPDKGEKLGEKIAEQLSQLQQMPDLIRSFFQAPSVAYIVSALLTTSLTPFI